MSLALIDDTDRIGHAIADLGTTRREALSVSLQFGDKTYLGSDGRRTRARHLFEGTPHDASGHLFRFGPEVTAHVREGEIVSIADADGTLLGTIVWDGIRVAPQAPGGVRLGASGSGAKPRRHGAPVFGPTSAKTPAPMPAAPAKADAVLPAAPPESAAPSPPDAAWHRPVLALAALLLVFAVLLATLCLAGVTGWTLAPRTLSFAGPRGGPFHPAADEARFTRAWWVAPVAPLFFGTTPPVSGDGAPPWLRLRQSPENADWTIAIAIDAQATRQLAPGSHFVMMPLAFPLRRQMQPGLAVMLNIEMPPTASPPASPPAAPPPEPSAPPAKQSTIDDATCDRLAGNRFDADHPADRSYKDEIFDLSADDLTAGLAACDPNPDRTGADRRFAVQRGRLLAHRGLRHLVDHDIADATRDMADALAAWRHGDALGSAYAANLLGAYYVGTFNRPQHTFITPDNEAADAFWLRAMRGGNVIAQRNYASQLLMGRGVAAEPARALDLLREALAKGDLRAAGALGVALYTGSPSGVHADKEAGWPLLVRSQCVDRAAGALLRQEVASGAHPASDQASCP